MSKKEQPQKIEQYIQNAELPKLKIVEIQTINNTVIRTTEISATANSFQDCKRGISFLIDKQIKLSKSNKTIVIPEKHGLI